MNEYLQVAIEEAERGVVVEVLQDPACIRLMTEFIRANPRLWNEDIGA